MAALQLPVELAVGLAPVMLEQNQSDTNHFVNSKILN
jgi:hypothetical protein